MFNKLLGGNYQVILDAETVKVLLYIFAIYKKFLYISLIVKQNNSQILFQFLIRRIY